MSLASATMLGMTVRTNYVLVVSLWIPRFLLLLLYLLLLSFSLCLSGFASFPSSLPSSASARPPPGPPLSVSSSFSSSSSAPILSALSASSSGLPPLSSVLHPRPGTFLPPPPLGFPPLSLSSSSLLSSPSFAPGSSSSLLAPPPTLPSLASSLPSSSSLPPFSFAPPSALAPVSSSSSSLSSAPSSSSLNFAAYQAHVLGLSDEYLSLVRWFVGAGGSNFLSFLSSHFPHLSADAFRDFSSGSYVLFSTLRSLSSALPSAPRLAAPSVSAPLPRAPALAPLPPPGFSSPFLPPLSSAPPPPLSSLPSGVASVDCSAASLRGSAVFPFLVWSAYSSSFWACALFVFCFSAFLDSPSCGFFGVCCCFRGSCSCSGGSRCVVSSL